MAVTYRIIAVDPPSERVPPPGIATVEVDFGDGSEVYRKRMMAPVTDREALVEAVEGWLAQYLADRTTATVPADVRKLLGTKRKVDGG